MPDYNGQSTTVCPAVVTGGYFIIARKLFYSLLMSSPPLYMKLWVWMLANAFWKDGDKLKRGQLLTSIDGMRDAMSYQVGYRKMRPTRDEIRSPYEAFMKASMITTTKTTRGMIVTICNYNFYQDFKSYEPLNESLNENTAKPLNTPHDREGSNKEVKTLKTSPSSLDEAVLEPDFYLTKKKKKLIGKRLDTFNLFWEAFGYPKGKADAADAWLAVPLLTDTVMTRIISSAKDTAQKRFALKEAGKTPQMAQGWISGRRWEDEPEGPVSTGQTLAVIPDHVKETYERMKAAGEI